MEWIQAKQILIKNKKPESWFGFDYTMNLYKGCCHGCIYCDSRSFCYRIDHFDTVRAKQNAIEILNRELRLKKEKGIVGMGSMSDPYNPFENEIKLTHNSLKLLDYYGFGVGINTKSDQVIHDLDLLKSIHQKNVAVVNMTITTADDELAKKIEPYAPVPSQRFEAVKACKKEGLIVGILMTPVLPFLTDSKENLLSIIQKAHDCHADYILTYMGMTLRENQRDYYYQKLDEMFSGLSFQYKKVFNNRYHCETPLWKENYALFKKECEKYHILYDMDDIVQLIRQRKKPLEQLTLFE